MPRKILLPTPPIEVIAASSSWSTVFVCASVVLGALVLLKMLSSLFAPRALDLRGKSVVITGGSSGIGLAIAKIVVAQGASVVLIARREAQLAGAWRAVRARNARARRPPSARRATRAT